MKANVAFCDHYKPAYASRVLFVVGTDFDNDWFRYLVHSEFPRERTENRCKMDLVVEQCGVCLITVDHQVNTKYFCSAQTVCSPTNLGDDLSRACFKSTAIFENSAIRHCFPSTQLRTMLPGMAASARSASRARSRRFGSLTCRTSRNIGAVT